MARVLLGVSGGIAAYKALELARLATLAGHGVRVLMTPAAMRFVGPASFEGIVGAPVLSDEFERDPMRGAFPGEAAPDARPDRPPRAGPERRRVPGRPGLGEHDREARRRDLRLDADHLVSRLHGAARGRAGDERPDVRRRRDPGEPGAARRARGDGDRPRARRARLARRARRRPARRARPAAGRGRGDAAAQRAEPGTGCASWSPPGGTREPIDAVRFIGNRSSGRMGLALAAAAARRGAEVTLVERQRRAARAGRCAGGRGRDDRASSPRRSRRSSRAPMCC